MSDREEYWNHHEVIEAKNAEFKKLEAELAAAKQQISEMDESIGDFEDENERLQEIIATQNKRIAELEAQLKTQPEGWYEVLVTERADERRKTVEEILAIIAPYRDYVVVGSIETEIRAKFCTSK